jgi:hypothetical protein
MSKTFNFIEEYQNISGSVISKIDLLEDDDIVMSMSGSNEGNSLYNLHRAWIYPNRRYTIVNGEEIFEKIINNN